MDELEALRARRAKLEAFVAKASILEERAKALLAIDTPSSADNAKAVVLSDITAFAEDARKLINELKGE